MSYLSELTAHERLTVDNATLDMFTAFENGSDLIYEVWERYFSDRVQKEIFLAALKLPLKFFIPHLLRNLVIACFIDPKNLAALRASYFLHTAIPLPFLSESFLERSDFIHIEFMSKISYFQGDFFMVH